MNKIMFKTHVTVFAAFDILKVECTNK